MSLNSQICSEKISSIIEQLSSPFCIESVSKESNFKIKSLIGSKKKRIKLAFELSVVNTAMAIHVSNKYFKRSEIVEIVDGFRGINNKYLFVFIKKEMDGFDSAFESRMEDYFSLFRSGADAIGISYAFLQNLNGIATPNVKSQVKLATRFTESLTLLSSTIKDLQTEKVRSPDIDIASIKRIQDKYKMASSADIKGKKKSVKVPPENRQKLYEVKPGELSNEFSQAWSYAGKHLQYQGDNGIVWLRNHLYPPMAEHLSFQIGNQLFFVFVEAAEFKYATRKQLFDKVCKKNNAVPCIMPMGKKGDGWYPDFPDWGLKHAVTDKVINPLDFVTDELVVMNDWEIHDFAVQFVKDKLVEMGKKIVSHHPSPEIDPSIWFEDDNGRHFIVIKGGKYPMTEISLPSNIASIRQNCSAMSDSGFFASVIFANADNDFSSNEFIPLYRSSGALTKYSGLEPL